jgi:hypothetical protein
MAGNPIDIDVLEKENKALHMRHREGKTFEAIARELGYANKGSAQKAYTRAMKRIEKPDPEIYLMEQLERLDQMVETYLEPAIAGNMRVAEFMLKLMDKQASLLGLDAPKKVQAEVVSYDGGPRSLNAEVVRVARLIDYIESVRDTTQPELNGESEQDSLGTDSAEGTVTT